MGSKRSKLFQQESKEFQMKLRWPVDGVVAATPAAEDDALFDIARRAIIDATEALAAGRRTDFEFNAQPWLREGIRYDTAQLELKRAQLTLAIEATDERTKLKCKQHHFVPELLFDADGQSLCQPDPATRERFGKAKFKLEQDLHFSNLKYCASGSLFLNGRRTAVSDIGFFSRHFPGLAARFPANTPLQPVSHWQETVYDDFRVRCGRRVVDSWMLVTRRDAARLGLLIHEGKRPTQGALHAAFLERLPDRPGDLRARPAGRPPSRLPRGAWPSSSGSGSYSSPSKASR